MDDQEPPQEEEPPQEYKPIYDDYYEHTVSGLLEDY